MGKAPQQAQERFRDNRLGMFIHYGLYSVLNRNEWAMYYERIPVDDYKKLADSFNPENLDINTWIKLAKKAGMKYACLTTRHHDGFSLFDTSVSNYNSVKTAAKRDIVKEFVQACRDHGIRPTLYYSVADWSDSGYTDGADKNPAGWKTFVEKAHIQLKELMTNYGPIDYIFYDGCPAPEAWGAAEINDELRQLQPALLISDRCQLDEDVASSEQLLTPHQKSWECCLTTNSSWGCNAGDPHRKSVYDLVNSLTTCMHHGGNLLLNLGPEANGSIHPEDQRLFEGLGEWIERNNEAVYGTKANPFDYCDQKLSCYRGTTTYTALHYYNGPDTVIAGIGNQVKKISLLSPNMNIDFEQIEDRVFLTGLPEKSPDIRPIIAMELDSPPKGVPHPYQSKATKFVF